MALKTDYKDDILSSVMGGKRKYEITYENGSKEYATIDDISSYEQIGDIFGAKDINDTNEEVNKKVSNTGGKLTGRLTFSNANIQNGALSIEVGGEDLDFLRLFMDGDEPVVIINDGLYARKIGVARLCAGRKVELLTQSERVVLEESNGEDTYTAYFRPRHDNKCTLGTTAYRFARVYAGNAAISTSDRREKENIIPLGESNRTTFARGIQQIDIHSELFNRLQPVQYNFIDGDGKVCYGLIAQDVISAMEEVGIGENELDLIHHNYHVDEETGEEKETFGIAYDNLIAMLIHEMQKAKAQIATLQEEVDSLRGL